MSKEKRYVVGLQDVKDKSCFKDFEETDVKAVAIRLADEGAKRAGRPCIVFERGSSEGIIYRTDKIRPEPKGKNRGKKR